ncbi:MAG: LysR family transcriptional regulator [Deltaproteobacteria bacterium]|nr:LysR family transcriptional regulator [Deltaproteobacteria bacterium]
MLNYNHLYYFHIAALEGSVASAASRLGVTQPTVSEQVRALERALGVALFERHPTGLRLTEAGRLAFEHTSVMFRAGEHLSEALGHGARAMPKTLRIGLSGSVARTTSTDFLMPLLALEECVPSIRAGDSVELLRDLRGSELDLVLCETEPPTPAQKGLEVVQLDTMTLIAVGSPELRLAPDWQDARMIHYRGTSAFRWDVENFLETRGLRPRVAAESDDALFLVEAAARGGYVVFVSRSIARDAVTNGRLVVLAELPPSHAGVYALYQDGASAELARRAVSVLVEHVRASR